MTKGSPLDQVGEQVLHTSLIICTRNRAPQLHRCLDAVAAIVFDRSWELVIVDNGSTDATRQVIEDFARSAPITVRYVFESVPGLSNARNAGLRQAHGELIVFTDDDCYPQADLLVEAERAFSDPKVGFVSGRIMLHDPDDYPATINESTKPLVFPAGRYLAPGAVKGANLAFRRKCLDEVNGFDPLFGSGALFPAEDIDTAARISRAGWVGLYVPEMVVSHHHGRKAGDIASLLRAYHIGRGAYHLKLLIADRAVGASLKGWLGLPKRALKRPSSIWWEGKGALGYLSAYRKGRSALANAG